MADQKITVSVGDIVEVESEIGNIRITVESDGMDLIFMNKKVSQVSIVPISNNRFVVKNEEWKYKVG